MTDDEAPVRGLVKVPDQTLAPARSLAERTLAELRNQGDHGLAVPRRLIVAADGSAMFTTIGAAIAIAVDGDEIIVEPGHYFEHLTINRSIRISGRGPRDSIVLAPPTPQAPCVAITGGSPSLIGFTIDGSTIVIPEGASDDDPIWGLVRVTGGAPVLDALNMIGGLAGGVLFGNAGTTGEIRACQVHDGEWAGITVEMGACPTIRNNDVWAFEWAGMEIRDPLTKPLIHGNRIHENAGTGIFIHRGARPAIEGNDVWDNLWDGIEISGIGTEPLLRGNRILGSVSVALYVWMGATPEIEGNEIWAGKLPAILVRDSGTNPVILANRVHGGSRVGIAVDVGARPRLESNEIWPLSAPPFEESGRLRTTNSETRGVLFHYEGSGKVEILAPTGHDVAESTTWSVESAGIAIHGAGTEPLVRANRIHDCDGAGIAVGSGAAPLIEENEISRSAKSGIRVSGPGTRAVIRANEIVGCSGSGILVHDGASPLIRDNELHLDHPAGLSISGAGGKAQITANRVHDCLGDGIYISEGATPRIERNEVWANARVGVEIVGPGTDPLVRANQIHNCPEGGALVSFGAAPQFEDNDVWANGRGGLAGLEITGRGTSPIVVGNTLRDGLGDGIDVLDGASPTVRGNTITRNAGQGLFVAADATPDIGPNVISA